MGYAVAFFAAVPRGAAARFHFRPPRGAPIDGTLWLAGLAGRDKRFPNHPPLAALSAANVRLIRSHILLDNDIVAAHRGDRRPSLNMHNSALNLHGVTHRVATAFAPTPPVPVQLLPRSTAVASKLTLSGCILFLTCALMFGSGFRAFRPEVMGLLVHPFLIPIAAVSPFLLVNRLKAFPARALSALMIFFLLYALSNVTGGRAAVSEIVKISTSGVAIVATALLIRSRGDFVAGVVGLGFASGTMGLYGMQATFHSSTGVAALDIGNKNAFSLFVLPAVLLCGYVFFEMPVKIKALRIVLKTLCVGSIGACALAIFLSGNRSGYVGCVIIGAMLLKEKKLYGFLLVGIVAAGVVYLMMSFQLTDVFQRRWNQTFVEKNESDELRGHILLTCFKIGLDYPIAGVSANKLPNHIGAVVGGMHAGINVIESHNVFAHTWASAGVFCFSALCFIGWSLWFMPPPPNKADLPLAAEFARAQRLLRMMVLLWMIRGMFTSSILYNPGFSIGLGLAIGYCSVLAAKPKRGTLGAGVPTMPTRYAALH
jgi:hypothetical protein